MVMSGLTILLGSSVLYALAYRLDAIRVAKQRQYSQQQQCHQQPPQLRHRPYTYYLATTCSCNLNSSCLTSSTLLPPLPITFSLHRTVAPMVNQSDHPFRMLTRKYGATCVFTQMLYANRIVEEDGEYRQRAVDFDPTTTPTAVHDRPLIVQFAANHADTLLRAAQLIEHLVDAVDINLGCPQDRAILGQYGSYLLHRRSWSLVSSMIVTLRRHLSIPVTCKIRLLSSFSETLEFCLLLHASGCSLITIHGRTQGSSSRRRAGLADLDMIRCLRLALSERGIDIPIVTNGNVREYIDVAQNIEFTRCQGVMSAEGVLANPRLFSESHAQKQHKETKEKEENNVMRQVEMAEEYLDFCHTHSPLPLLHIIADHIHNILRSFLSHHPDLKLRLKTIGREKKEYVCELKPMRMTESEARDGVKKIEDVIKDVKVRLEQVASTATHAAPSNATSSSSSSSASRAAASNYRRQQRQADKILAETMSELDADDMTSLFDA